MSEQQSHIVMSYKHFIAAYLFAYMSSLTSMNVVFCLLASFVIYCEGNSMRKLRAIQDDILELCDKTCALIAINLS